MEVCSNLHDRQASRIKLWQNDSNIVANALEPNKENNDEEIKRVIMKYINKVPDVEANYVVNERLSKIISQYFQGKINTFPLYRISLKIDRNPIKIPWILGQPTNVNGTTQGKRYTYVKRQKNKMYK
ncbi:uncharacterized protein LOC131844470 [Achroia grisella]|uniref:uncharacterized protein LOC131844470 n=1 Tax=Achroia grisella TaxID=688607 RepID=UPI0027D2E7E3|nr:uncharacterized protein LOC131844470 [Achroia grisella]